MNYNMTYKEGSNVSWAIWQSWYGLVNSANAAVIALTNLDVKLYPSPETKEALIAEARCMRAWAYANLFWMFGHWWEADDCAYGILYRDQMANLSNLQVPRITVGTILSENLRGSGTGSEAFTRFYDTPLFVETIGSGSESEAVIEPGSDAR